MKCFVTLISMFLLLVSCTEENNDNENTDKTSIKTGELNKSETDSIFSSISDTTSIFRLTKIDSSELQNYKSYVKSNAYRFEGESVAHIDSSFMKIIDEINEYVEVKNYVDVELIEKTEKVDPDPFELDNEKPDSVKSPYLEILITNDSKKIINAVKLDFRAYDTYQEFSGGFDFEIINDLKPGESHQERLKKMSSTFEIHFEQEEPLYIVSNIERIAISNGTNLDSRLDGDVYDFSEYELPDFYQGERGESIHGIFLEQE